MAKSRFEYVKHFEILDECLRNCWIVVRVDGKNFHKFSVAHNFKKPNDDNALDLMNESACGVMRLFHDIILAYGASDEYSFVFKKATKTYNRRASKLSSTVVSQFSSSYTFHWTKYFPNQKLLYPPVFDSRVVLYPSDMNMRDYLSWRQADCHINNLFNTCFWNLVHDGMTTKQAEASLKGTNSSEKNELLFSKFRTNYNDLPQVYRKGTIILRKKGCADYSKKDELFQPNSNSRFEVLHEDIIGQDFWTEHADLLT
ncbi:putative tRNA(His) guanylyltransferase [Styela clava]|uniref:probable tRNA(His) guanylyltransferase n=1 Tax=Styela clava TaxID=7725 RepID=UPI001939D179|nr:probable tRNA(His) guanylyltransferase [Styela clava]